MGKRFREGNTGRNLLDSELESMCVWLQNLSQCNTRVNLHGLNIIIIVNMSIGGMKNLPDLWCPVFTTRNGSQGNHLSFKTSLSSLSLESCVFLILGRFFQTHYFQLWPHLFFHLVCNGAVSLRACGRGAGVSNLFWKENPQEGILRGEAGVGKGMREALGQEGWQGSEQATFHSQRSWLERVETLTMLTTGF